MSFYYYEARNGFRGAYIGRIVLTGVGIALCIIAGFMFGLPPYYVWSEALHGQSELKRAEYNRQIAVQEAEAKKNAASLLAEAEVLRAEGVARANQIIGESLKGNEAYLRYLWIDTLAKDDKQIIYVPTEAGLPILEAGKRP